MPHSTDLRPVATTLYFQHVTNRVPFKFGRETVTGGTCSRVSLRARDRQGREVEGWGETPLAATWVWPSAMSFEGREDVLKQFSIKLAAAWAKFDVFGHPMEVGRAFQDDVLPGLLEDYNRVRGAGAEPMPWLAALVCCSAFDIALHDAFGILVGRPVYQTYGPEFMNRDLAHFLKPAAGTAVSFAGKYPQDFFVRPLPTKVPVWHLVGGVDPLEPGDLTGAEPKDGYPVLLRDWIKRDGLRCLKIKLRGIDAPWDYARTVHVGRIAAELDVPWLTADFNCTVTEPGYVNEILDRLRDEHPRTYGSLLYVEQPFPYDLEKHRIDVHSVSARKPLFMDESAHDWKHVAVGRELGWSGVALKTCKTQTGALLSGCWAKAHGMTLMVQDLTNPMLAMLPHAQLTAHIGTIMGVEANSMQFYPDASLAEARVHPGLFQRRDGQLDLSSIHGNGFGYRLAEITRTLPAPAASFGG
ncbi:MAG: mandelate racemase/muconate lactonizing enzyme family protein [Verrucomicrobia bacterium]|nr:mandelate racemase/muconate lactonizing enzyme family protein [Verrucomicrobiota bacterium]